MDLFEIGRLRSVLVKHAREAFISQKVIDAQWKAIRVARGSTSAASANCLPGKPSIDAKIPVTWPPGRA